MNYFGVKAIENIINQIEKLLSIKTLERKLEKTLKNKKISCYKLLTYDFILLILYKSYTNTSSVILGLYNVTSFSEAFFLDKSS